MDFEFDYGDLEKDTAEAKCPWAIAERLFLHTGMKLHKGMTFWITNSTRHALGFDIRFGNKLLEGRLFVLYRERLERDGTPENLQLFDLVTTNVKHGGKAAEMSLEFLLKTLE